MKKKSINVSIIFSIIVGLIIYAFLFAGIIHEIQKNKDINLCTERMHATIIEVKHEYEYKSAINYYYNVYQYKYGDKTYTIQSKPNDNYKNSTIGDKVMIYVNPDDPNMCADENDKSSAMLMIILYILGFIVITIVTILVILAIKKEKNKEKYI